MKLSTAHNAASQSPTTDGTAPPGDPSSQHVADAAPHDAAPSPVTDDYARPGNPPSQHVADAAMHDAAPATLAPTPPLSAFYGGSLDSDEDEI